MHKRDCTEKGFTIIELVVIMVVIGILTGISVIAYSGIQDRAHRSNLQVSLKQYQAIIKLASDEDVNNIYQTCLGQPSDYPATDSMPAGVCVSGDGPYVMRLPITTDNANYSLLKKIASLPSLDVRKPVESSGGIRFRGAAIVHGISVENGSETYILYRAPSSGCLEKDMPTSEFSSHSGSDLRFWILEGVCAQSVEDKRIQCRDYSTLMFFDPSTFGC